MVDEDLKLKARELWATGTPHHQIAKIVGRRKQTIYNWAKEGNWNEVQKNTTEQAMIRQDINLINEKERSLKLIKAAESLYAKELQTSLVMPKSTAQFAQLQKVKWEILMPKTVSQFNFMKQETVNLGLNQEEVTRIMEVLDGRPTPKKEDL